MPEHADQIPDIIQKLKNVRVSLEYFIDDGELSKTEIEKFLDKVDAVENWSLQKVREFQEEFNELLQNAGIQQEFS